MLATLVLCLPCAWRCNPWINILVALCSPSRKYLWGLLLCSSCDKFNFIFLGFIACLHFLLFMIVVFFFSWHSWATLNVLVLYYIGILSSIMLSDPKPFWKLKEHIWILKLLWKLPDHFLAFSTSQGMLLSNYFFLHFSAGGPTPSSLRRRTQNYRNKINQSRNVDCKISKYNIHVYIVRSIIQRGIFIKKCPWYQGSMGSKSYCLRWPTFPDIKQISVKYRNVIQQVNDKRSYKRRIPHIGAVWSGVNKLHSWMTFLGKISLGRAFSCSGESLFCTYWILKKRKEKKRKGYPKWLCL